MKEITLPMIKSDAATSGGNVLRRMAVVARGVGSGKIPANSPYAVQLGYLIGAWIERYSIAGVAQGLRLYWDLPLHARHCSELGNDQPPAKLDDVTRFILSRHALLPKCPRRSLQRKGRNKMC